MANPFQILVPQSNGKKAKMLPRRQLKKLKRTRNLVPRELLPKKKTMRAFSVCSDQFPSMVKKLIN